MTFTKEEFFKIKYYATLKDGCTATMCDRCPLYIHNKNHSSLSSTEEYCKAKEYFVKYKLNDEKLPNASYYIDMHRPILKDIKRRILKDILE